MRIYSMTATFGKLEHDTLTLKPGMNVIHAPNEWGKSTWCAFLLAMFYGLDTRARATRAALPEKERYAPWSGSPMSGRITLNWNGRDITIERTTQGRIPLGSFRAYETDTGLAVPELDGSNCGQLLLGVERSVFQRAGFIRFSDLPVTQDDALRGRLNALVTTGDDSGDGAKLEKGLRELKNRCRYNRSGLLPQAQQQYRQLQATLEELDALEAQQARIAQALKENTTSQERLTTHAAALAYRQYQLDARRVSQAEQALFQAEEQKNKLEKACQGLPSPEEIRKKLEELQSHGRKLVVFQEEQQSLPLPPVLPQPEDCFLGMEPAQAAALAEADARAYEKWSAKPWPLYGLGALALICAGVLFWNSQMLPGALTGAAGCLFLLWAAVLMGMNGKRRQALARRYGSPNSSLWREKAEAYAWEMEDYRRQEADYRRSREELAQRRQALKQQHQALVGDGELEQLCQDLEGMNRQWEALNAARQEADQARGEWEALKSMLRPVPPSTEADDCPLDSVQTAAQLQGLQEQERQLRSREGECRGRMEALGSRKALVSQLEQLEGRIRELEKYDLALSLAQQTLTQASQELQRRFAPRISSQAQQLLSRLTGGRYRRLLLESDFSLLAGTEQEDTLRSALWRSDGTMDQLYLALRLSTAQALTPEAPLILDDALVRFDEERLEAAMQVLQELAQTRQIILFTCQQREEQAIRK